MKFVRSLLLGSAAGICVAPVAQAADLPARAVAPVEYVQACYTAERKSNRSLNGFFALPGTDTCLRISGRARFSYQYTSSRGESSILGNNRGFVGGDNSGFQTQAQINLDARTKTDLGTLRTFIRVIAGYNSGGHLNSGTTQRMAYGYPALGMDTFGRAQSQIYLDKAFIQYVGFTAGRAASFFDFYAHDVEFIGATSGSNVGSTNLLAYTATFGGGWSATISMEDPIARRQPRFADFAAGSAITGSPNFGNLAGPFTQGVSYIGSNGQTRVANYDVVQRSSVPDFVAAVRYAAPWGAAQVSAAMHQLSGGRLMSVGARGASTGTGLAQAIADGVPNKVKDEFGWAVQGGLKVNLPQLAQGDVLWLQAAYSEGALSYAGHPARMVGGATLSNVYSGRFLVSTVDSFIGADGKQKLTEAWSVSAAFLHYWTPQWRSAVFGSYGEVAFGKGARTLMTDVRGSAAGAQFDGRLHDYSIAVVGANLIWSPVRGLDIGVEGVYTRADLKGGRVADLTYGSQNFNNLVAGVGGKTAKSDDLWAFRMRVQRDF
ncbi:porin [Enterovirga rhinocerotis]|uniref:Porin n=1 Tax=Enterovirga rhinocerotis TaxID=1339210 RepID=A0A4R7BYP2_9HYPH|nr:porin [Enterovirga rhinocerotis]TDR89885.1 porin-like protein [Enterovirga rhinocerotis]